MMQYMYLPSSCTDYMYIHTCTLSYFLSLPPLSMELVVVADTLPLRYVEHLFCGVFLPVLTVGYRELSRQSINQTSDHVR